DERPLNLVQTFVFVPADPFDGHDLASLRLAGQDQTGAHEDAVEVDRARSALALLAGILRAGQIEMLARRVQQARALPYAVRLPPLAVDGQGQAHRYASQAQLSVRRARTPSA